VKAGLTPFLTTGSNVTNVAYVNIATNSGLALSTYVIKNGSVDLGFESQNPARTLEIAAGDTFTIYAIAYGYIAKLITSTASNLNSFMFSLVPETNVDTTLNTTTRDFIVSKFSIATVDSKLVLSLNYDLRTYTPEEVLNAIHYFVVTSATIGAAVAYGGFTDGILIRQGGLLISTPAFYGKVADSVTTTTDLGILMPIFIAVADSVYVTDPTYVPVKKNSSGITLQTAPWTKQTAAIASTDKVDIATFVWANSNGASVSSNTKLIGGLF
jgi:hypothetical protein